MSEGDASDRSDIEETEDPHYEHVYKPTYVIIAIDTHPGMFIKNKNGEIPFRNCLAACYEIANSLIFVRDSRSWNPFAVVIARENPLFIDFKANILDSIKLLKEKLALTDEAQLKAEFGRKSNFFDLSEFFLNCKKLFHDITSTFYVRKLFFITNDDNPVKDKGKRFTVFKQVQTFPGSQIEFQILPTRENFNYKLFYNELFSILGPTPEEICTDVEGLTQRLISAVSPRHFKGRMNFYPFRDDPTRFIKCVSISPCHYSNLNNIPMTKDGKRIKPSHELDENASVSSFKRHGEPNIPTFEKPEIDSLLDYSYAKGYTLLYISKSLTPVGVSKVHLIQPDAKDSNPYFKQFWQYCVNNDRVLICVQKFRQPSKLNYAELAPYKLNGICVFLCKRLPFANERVFPRPRDYIKFERDPEKEKAVEKLVNAMTFEFDVDMIPDPVFRKKKHYVRAKLLDEPEPSEEESFKKESWDDKLQEVTEEIKSKFDLTVEERKRKTYGRPKGSPFKRQRK